MGIKIAGIGIGLFIVAVLWVLALFLCVFLSRAQGNITFAGFGAIVVTLLVTLVLWVFPRGPDSVQETNMIYDEYIIGRYVLLALTILMTLVGFVVFFGEHLSSQRFAVPLKDMK